MTDFVGDEQELVDRQMDAQRTQLAEVKVADAVQDWSRSPAAVAAGHVATEAEAIAKFGPRVEPTAEEIAAKKLWPDVKTSILEDEAFADERIQAAIKIADLEAQLRVLNEKLTAVRKAKDGYKAIASQGVKDLAYVKKMVGMVYAERRADEMQKEFEAVKDEN